MPNKGREDIYERRQPEQAVRLASVAQGILLGTLTPLHRCGAVTLGPDTDGYLVRDTDGVIVITAG